MPLPFDATLKSIIAGRPADFASLFGLPADEPVRAVNVDLSVISAATDVALAYGEPIREVVDLNFQSGPDANLAGRLHLYNAALNHRHAVPVRSVVVLLRPKADSANVTGLLAYGEDDSRVEFHYRVIRLWQHPVEDLLHLGVSALSLAVLGRLPADRPLTDALREVVQTIRQRLDRESDEAEAATVLTAAYTLAGMRVESPDLNQIFRGIGIVNATTAWDAALEEGERRGELKWKVENSHQLLLRQGRKRFGPPADGTEAELKSIRDLDRLERLADAILTASSWQEWLATQ